MRPCILQCAAGSQGRALLHFGSNTAARELEATGSQWRLYCLWYPCCDYSFAAFLSSAWCLARETLPVIFFTTTTMSSLILLEVAHIVVSALTLLVHCC